MPIRRTESEGTPPRRLHPFAIVGIVLTATLSIAGGIGLIAPAGAATPKVTVVSLTFDDANADQVPAASTLVANGLRGTFFLNSGFLNASGYMTSAQVKALAAAGHEIGGHTVNHPDLTSISASEAKNQICQDRANLSALGVPVSDFAYPFASENASVEQIVKQCGYNSARGLGDIKSRFGCDDCAYAETIPPAQPLITKALDEVESDWTLQDLQAPVLNAAAKGGWVQYTFHHICDGSGTCDAPSVTSGLFGQFVQWLSARANAPGSTTQVKTVAQVINKAVKPVVQGSVKAAAGPGVNGISNPGMETVDATTGVPTCHQLGGYGTNTPAFSRSSAAHGGTGAEQLVMSGYSDGDAKLLPTLDLGSCSPTTVAGHTYSLREWYTASTVTQFAVYTRDTTGTWKYWTSSPWFPASTTYAQAVWTTPALPTGTNGITFGLNLFQNGTLVTDDMALYDTVGAPAVGTASASAKIPATTNRRFPGAEKKGTIQVSEEPTAESAEGVTG